VARAVRLVVLRIGQGGDVALMARRVHALVNLKMGMVVEVALWVRLVLCGQ
jgi:hypothetical protein